MIYKNNIVTVSNYRKKERKRILPLVAVADFLKLDSSCSVNFNFIISIDNIYG